MGSRVQEIMIYHKDSRMCITCDTDVSTVRFSCGHSCLCSNCLGRLVATQVSFVASKCPLCRTRIDLGALENERCVAIQAEFTTPGVCENEHSPMAQRYRDDLLEAFDCMDGSIVAC